MQKRNQIQNLMPKLKINIGLNILIKIYRFKYTQMPMQFAYATEVYYGMLNTEH